MHSPLLKGSLLYVCSCCLHSCSMLASILIYSISKLNCKLQCQSNFSVFCVAQRYLTLWCRLSLNWSQASQVLTSRKSFKLETFLFCSNIFNLSGLVPKPHAFGYWFDRRTSKHWDQYKFLNADTNFLQTKQILQKSENVATWKYMVQHQSPWYSWLLLTIIKPSACYLPHSR